MFVKIKRATVTLKPFFKHISEYLNKNPIILNLFFSFQTTKILYLPVMVITCMSFLFTSGKEVRKWSKEFRKWSQEQGVQKLTSGLGSETEQKQKQEYAADKGM